MKIIGFRATTEYDRQIRTVAAMLDMNRSDFIRWAVDEKIAELDRHALLGVDLTPQPTRAEVERERAR